MKALKIRKIVTVLALVSVFAVGAQSAFAGINIYEQNDSTNGNIFTAEPFLAGVPAGTTNPFGYSKVGKLTSPSDRDWYSVSFPSYTWSPGATALISLLWPTGYYYNLTITDEWGGYVDKNIVTTSDNLYQFTFEFQPNTVYKLHVSAGGPDVSPNTNYILSID